MWVNVRVFKAIMENINGANVNELSKADDRYWVCFMQGTIMDVGLVSPNKEKKLHDRNWNSKLYKCINKKSTSNPNEVHGDIKKK